MQNLCPKVADMPFITIAEIGTTGVGFKNTPNEVVKMISHNVT
jgi:hypothetical protein